MIKSIYNVFVPTGLVILMFGMGLQLVKDDWLRLVREPMAVVAGLLGQVVMLPALAFLLVFLIPLPQAVAAGVVILAACPGGVTSNSISFLARADLALSVTLTAATSVLALVTVPLVVALGLSIVQHGLAQTTAADSLHLPVGATFRQLLILVILPLAAGMLARRFAGKIALRSEPWLRVGSVVVLLVLLLGAVGLEFEFFLENFKAVWQVLLLLNLAGMAGGYVLARMFRLGIPQRRTIAIEVGIQNVALGVLIALNILKQPEWMVVPSVYSIVMMLTSFVLVAVVNLRRNGKATGTVSAGS